MTLRTLAYAAMTSMSVMQLSAANISHDDFKKVPFGDMPAGKPIVTNVEDVVIKVADGIDKKADRFILGRNLTSLDLIYKLTPANQDTTGSESSFPFEFVYSNTTNLMETVKLYDTALRSVPQAPESPESAPDLSFFSLVNDSDGKLQFMFKNNGSMVYVPVSIVETVEGRVINADLEEATTYEYSHPYDWKIHWEALPDTDTTTAISVESRTNVVGQVLVTTASETIKNSKAALSVSYFDELNAPNFALVNYAVVDGDATISGNILTANSEGVVNVRATNDNGEHRDAPVSMYTWKTETSTSVYTEDRAANRKRVNDWHLSMLQKYRSNPTTNRNYSTWNEPTSTKHIGWKGDMFNGEYGKRFFPYCHMTVNSSGDSSWWYAHGIISKHVLLAANHYGDWNHSRCKGWTVYVDYPGYFGEKVPVKLVQYVNLNTWAKENGFEGTDAQMGDIGAYILSTAEFDGGANNGIPDKFLPYLATVDYLNATYGYNYEQNGRKDGLCGITLNQANMVGLRSFSAPLWASWYNPYREGTIDVSDGPVTELNFREDIAKMARRCGWHNIVMGDSGNPVFIYDPALTVEGVTYDFGDGDGAVPLLRPILLTSHTTAGGGTAIGLKLRVIRAFCAAQGDTLDYVLGNIDEQSSDSSIATERAIELTKNLKLGPNAE